MEVVLREGEYVFSGDAVRALAATDLTLVSTGLEAAELVVALASSQVKAAVVSAALSRKALAVFSEKYRKQVEAFWDEAHEEALELLVLVLQNNPTKEKSLLFERPDVQSALTQPYLEAAVKAQSLLQEAWAGTADLTEKYLRSEFKLLKENWQGYETDSALLYSLVGDLRANAEVMRSRYVAAVEDALPGKVEEALSKVAKDSTRRAGYTATTLVWGHASEVRDSAFAKAGLNKMWVARVEDVENPPCSHCKALHGKVIAPGEQFPINGLKAYRNLLYGPPRHPNCRCVIVGTKLKKNGNS